MIPISKPYIGPEEKQNVQDVLDSGMLVQGPKTKELEERFAEVCNVKYAVATSSGTTALHLALLAHGIGPGDEVITTPFTFIATVNSILFVGATPVFVDIDEKTFNINVHQIEKAITPKTRAIMPVHLFGQMCQMDILEGLANKHKLVIIEDAAQAIGARFKGQAAGSIGTGTFSLYATKNIMCGEGGMITTNDSEIADRLRLLRSHGMRERYMYEMLGYNFRISDLHSAIGLAQLARLDAFNKARSAHAAYFNENIQGVNVPLAHSDCEHVWHQYTVRIEKNRNQFIEHLQNRGIGTGVFYPIPAHGYQHVKDIVGEVSLPVAERLSKEVVSLPVHPQLRKEELKQIVDEVNAIWLKWESSA